MYEIFEQLLQKFNYTAYKVSKDTGIPQSTIYSWKSSNRRISSDIGERLAAYFNVSIDYLMTGTERSDKETTFEAQNGTERKVLMLCRKAGEISEEERELLVKQFESTVDMFLKVKGLK